MNNLRNRVQLIGDIGDNISFQKNAGEESQIRTCLATKEINEVNAGKKVVKLQWHHLVAWGKTAEFMNTLLRKGNRVAVEGKLKQHTFKDEKGISRYYSEVIVDEFVLLS